MADRIVTAGEDDRTPNWDKWRLIRSPQLWQCVALSLNIDPDKVNMHYDEMSGDVTFNESQEFQDRLDVLRANFGRDGLPVHPRSCPMSLRSFAAEVRRIGFWKAPAELLAMADEQVAIEADRAHTGKRTGAATVTRETRKAKRLGDLKRFIDDVYEALDKDGYKTGEKGDRTPLPLSPDDLHTLFLVRHPEHKVARSTFDDDLGKLATVKSGPKRYEIKGLAEMLAGKFSD
jgi:hypothetical protein